MGWSLGADAAAVNARRSSSSSHGSLSVSLHTLSSGWWTNRPPDAVPTAARSYSGRLQEAVQNAENGSTVVRTVDEALTAVHSILRRLRELAVQAADEQSADARAGLQQQARELTTELGRIAGSTSFDGTPLLDGSAGTLTFVVTADGATAVTVDLRGADVGSLAQQLATAGPDLSTPAGARHAIDTIEAQLGAVCAQRTRLDGAREQLGRTLANANVAVENLSASQSRVRGADLATEMVTFAWAQILTQAGSAMLSQANSIPRGVYRLLE